MYIPPGPARPDPATVAAFIARARQARPAAAIADPVDVRWIGLDRTSTDQILALIRAGDKTGTFTLPWIVERTAMPEPQPGRAIVLIDFDSQPALLVRLTDVVRVPFGAVTAAHTAIDGSPVRAIEVWRPLHTHYWTELLRPFELTVSDEMPVLIEPFEIIYDPTTA